MSEPADDRSSEPGRRANSSPCCPLCGGLLVEIRGVWSCRQCRALVEACCEGIAPNPRKLRRDAAPQPRAPISRAR